MPTTRPERAVDWREIAIIRVFAFVFSSYMEFVHFIIFKEKNYFIYNKYIVSAFDVQIQEYCDARGVRHERATVALPITEFHSAHLHLVTLSDASPSGPTLFYAHGGGYQYPMRARGCMPLVFYLARSWKAARIAFLEYSLTPTTQYPGQLIQAIEALRYLIDQGTSPSDLVLGGDSAGGYLIAGLLLHMKKPAPRVRPLEP